MVTWSLIWMVWAGTGSEALKITAVPPALAEQQLFLGRLSGFARLGDHLLLLDRGEKQVKRIDERGLVVSVFGAAGQGPGEFIDPIAIAYRNGDVWVYDNKKGAVLQFSEEGDYLNQITVRRGYAATFLEQGILIQSAGTAQLFHLYDLAGNYIRGFGEAPPVGRSITALLEQISRVVVDEKAARVFAFTVGGTKMEAFDLRSGRLLYAKDPGLEGFGSRDQGKGMSAKDGGQGIRLKTRQPVKGALPLGDHLLVLVVDENQEQQANFALFTRKGEKVAIQSAPRYFNQFYADGEDVLLYHRDSEWLERVRIALDERVL